MSIDDLLHEAKQRSAMRESIRVLQDPEGRIKPEIIAAGLMSIVLVHNIAKQNPSLSMASAVACIVTTMLGGNPDGDPHDQAALVLEHVDEMFDIIAGCSAYSALYIQDMEDSQDAN